MLLFYHFHRDPAHSAGWRICFTRNETEGEPRSNRMLESERAGAEKVLASTSNTCTPGTNHTPVFYKNSDGFGKREWRKKVACEGRAEERPTSSPGPLFRAMHAKSLGSSLRLAGFHHTHSEATRLPKKSPIHAQTQSYLLRVSNFD